MKISECHLCEYYQRDDKNRNDRCELNGKALQSISKCPKTESIKPWTKEDVTELKKQLLSGNHIGNIAIFMNRKYVEVEAKMNKLYLPHDDERNCLNCGRSGYCHKQYISGCDLGEWKPLTPRQIKERILLESRKGGLGITY